MARIKPHKPDYVLAIIVLILVVFGLVSIASAGIFISFEHFGNSYYYLQHQILYGVLIGTVVWIIVSKIDYHKWIKVSPFLLLATFVLLVAVFIPQVGIEHGGAKRWINLGFTSIQPAEIVKLIFILYLAAWLEKRGKGIKDFYYGFLPFIFTLCMIALLIILQPDVGTLAVISMTAITIYFIAGANLWHIFTLGIGGILVFLGLIKLAPYRMARFTVFLNPELDTQGIGYQINQALLAIGSGGLLGLGLGHSRQKYNYLPEVIGDSIFAIIAEELGFIFCVALIILFVILAYRGFKIAMGAPDKFGRSVAAGITTWFVLQAFINIASMIALVPLTGIPLPFISYGGSSLVFSLAGVGILMNISKYTLEGRTVSSESREVVRRKKRR